MDGQILTIVLFVIQALMTLVGGAIAWWVNTTWQRVSSLERQLHLFEVKVAGEYVSNAELERMLKPLMDELQKIDRKLDEKADKP